MTGPVAANPANDSIPAEFVRTVAESVPHMAWISLPDGRTVYRNSRVIAYTGMTSGQLDGWGWKSVIHPDDFEACRARWEACAALGQPFEAECRIRRHDGAYRWHLDAAVPMRGADGRIYLWFGTCTDIHGVKGEASRLEEEVARRTRALAESEARWRSVMTLSSDFYWETDREHRFTVLQVGGRSTQVFFAATRLGRTRWEAPAVYPDEQGWEAHRQVLGRREAFRDLRIARRREDGTVRHYTVDGEPVFDENGAFVGYRGVGRDITEQVRAQDALVASAQEVRSLVARVVNVQEAERRKVANDLHDLVGQKLTALVIGLDILRQELPADAGTRLAPRLSRLSGLVGETIDATRALMSELHPPMLVDHGLLSTLHWYASVHRQRTGVEVRVSGAEPGQRLARETEIALFRIAQEALTNVAKHSGAGFARVDIEQDGCRVCMRIEDDGGTKDTGAAVPAGQGGWGLPAMRERAQAVGGALRVERGARGFAVIVEVPVHNAG